MEARATLLDLQRIDAYYGSVRALHQLSLTVREGEIVALIGANGAGKTTTLRVISGLLRAEGQVLYRGKSIAGWVAERIVSMGICQVPEGRRIFPGLTVWENLELGACAWRRRGDKIDGELEQVLALFPRLKQLAKRAGWSLSGGEQQMLAIGRALMARPTLLLLDEPSMGLAPVLVQEVFRTIQDINRRGTAVLLVEQNAFMALEIAERVYVMENGEIVAADTAAKLAEDPLVKQAYLGG